MREGGIVSSTKTGSIAMEAIANPTTADAVLEARRELKREYQRMYRLAHQEAYKAATQRSNAIMIQRRREVPEIRAKHIEEHKIYNHTHREQCNAYKRAYRARKREERKAAAEAGAELAAEAGVGGG